MILTSSLLVSMVLLGAGMLFWGLWIATFRAATDNQKWRFEFYAFDFGVGALVAGLAGALTVGSLGWDGFAVFDELGLAGKRQELWAFLAGLTFTLGNMLMLGAASIGGVLLAVPLAMGLAFSLGEILTNLANPGGSWLMLGASFATAIAAVVFGYLAWQAVLWKRLEAAIQAGKTRSTRRTVNPKGFVLTIIGGLFLAGFFPFYEFAKVPDLGVGPYSGGLLVGFGIFASTIMFNLFFMNLPVQGEPAEFGQFFRGTIRNHLLGFLGGFLWAAGTVAHFVAVRSEGAALPRQVWLTAALGLPAVIAGVYGLFAGGELQNAESKVRTFATSMLLLVLIAVGLAAAAQLSHAA
jgi:glucose uptake protein